MNTLNPRIRPGLAEVILLTFVSLASIIGLEMERIRLSITRKIDPVREGGNVVKGGFIFLVVLVASTIVYGIVISFFPGAGFSSRVQIGLTLSFGVFCVVAFIVYDWAKKLLPDDVQPEGA